MAEEPAIACQGLRMNYGPMAVLRGVDLEVPSGTIFALLGTNGAGKTTLIRTLLGLMPRTDGKASVLGQDPWAAGAPLRQGIGYVSEEQGLYNWMNVSQLVKFCRGLYDRWNQDLVTEYLQRFALPPKKRIGTMSKGQKVRLALILSLAPEPDLLILDEPMSGLDPLAQHEFLRIIQEVAARQGRTIFFSTHNLADVEAVATHVAILDDGVIKIAGPMAAVRASVKRLQVSSREAGAAPPSAVLLESGETAAMYLIPADSNLVESAAGNSGQAEISQATLSEVFLYFCAGGRDHADGHLSAS